MSTSPSGSLYDLTGNKIENTYGRLAQVIPGATESNADTRTSTPELYDGYGNKVTGIKFQEAFERDSNGDLQPTLGPFVDMFWEEDQDGNKQPRDIKFWLDENYNLITLPNS
jgi:hypothetical protein